MDKIKLIDRLKDATYKIILPVYLWSIGFKTLDSYIDAVVKDCKRYDAAETN